MKAVILAGGPDVPGCPLALVRPKPLYPLVTDVVIGKLLRALNATTDVDEAVICANGKTRVLREHFVRRPSDLLSLDFSDDELPRGAAGCLRDVEAFLGDDTFLVVEAGLFVDGGLADLIEKHRASGAALTMATVPASERQGGDGRGPQGEPLSPLGVYVGEPSILEHIPAYGYCDLKEQLVPKLRSAGARVSLSQYRGRHRRVTSASSYAALVQELLYGVFGREDFAGLEEIESQVWKAEGAEIDPTARVVGPVVIGPGATVGPGAIVAGPTVVGECATIAEKAFVGGSILWPNCWVGYGANLDRCIVTDRFRVANVARLSHSVAVDTAPCVGEARGLSMSGYSVQVQEPMLPPAQRRGVFMTALSGLRQVLAAMRRRTHDDGAAELPPGEDRLR